MRRPLVCAGGVLADALDVASRLGGAPPLQLAALGAGLAAVGTNLAATLLLEPAAASPDLQRALLIGVNLGAGLTPVASLATVLWRDALVRRGVPVPWRAYLVLAVPLSVAFVAATPLLA